QRYQTSFTVEPRELQLPAVELRDGIFVPGDLPPASGTADDPIIQSVDAPGTLINGGVAQLRIHLQDPPPAADVSTVRFRVTGASGFVGSSETPATWAGNVVPAEIQVDAEFMAPTSAAAAERFATQAAIASGSFDTLVQLVSDVGRFGNPFPLAFS